MSFWSYAASLKQVFSFLDFCIVYLITLLGRCAMFSLPVLGLAMLLRQLARNSTFAKGSAWAAMVPVLFLGKLDIYYKSRAFLPALHWQSWCCGYLWIRYGYLLGVIVSLALLCRRRAKLRRMLRSLPMAVIDGQRVYLCDMPVSPFTAGVLSPKIVIPTVAREQLDEKELRTVILHERTHIRLGHLWYFLVWDVFCTLFWVDPFLRLAAPKLKEDMEHICDAVTIQCDGQDAVSYGRVILKSLALLRQRAAYLPATFAGENDFAGAKRRLRRVRDYRPYSRRRVGALAASIVALLLLATLAIHQISLPRCTDLTGFTILHVSENVHFTTIYESETDGPPITLDGDHAEVDNTALRPLLSEDAPQDGWYYIMWGGFMKVPGIGGAMNSIYVDVLSDGATTTAAFEDVNEQFYVKLAKWI